MTESPGEETLFNLLKDDALTKEWTILHSLHIARHVSKTKGEADFVVLIPTIGVIVLEIKSHRSISVNEGIWTLGVDKPPHESPFVQAEKAMFSIRKELLGKLSFARGIPFLNMCWFTSLEFPKEDAFEWLGWQVLNSDDLISPAAALLRSASLGLKHLRDTVSRDIGRNQAFGEIQIKHIVECLRPNFEYSLSEKVIRSERKQQLFTYVQDQYAALDLFSMVPRVIFKGPAGTGKSLLAVELARRSAHQVKKVRLICFNNLLAQNLKEQVSHPNLEISTVDSLGYRIAKRDPNSHLSENPLEALRSINLEELSIPEEFKADLLVIDEAQDIFNTRYLKFLDGLLKEGMSKGNWVAFGDFDAQRIYWAEDNIDLVRHRFGDVPIAPLSKNCRNVAQIGHFAEGVLPQLPRWSAFLRDGQNPDPKLIPILPDEDMIPLLDDLIDGFRREHFSFDEIVVLSPLEIPDPSVLFSESRYSEKYVGVDERRSGRITFATIGRFKGLESSCVIGLDLEQLVSWKTKNELLYILFTRATDRLAIMANKQSQTMLIASLEGTK